MHIIQHDMYVPIKYQFLKYNSDLASMITIKKPNPFPNIHYHKKYQNP